MFYPKWPAFQQLLLFPPRWPCMCPPPAPSHPASALPCGSRWPTLHLSVRTKLEPGRACCGCMWLWPTVKAGGVRVVTSSYSESPSRPPSPLPWPPPHCGWHMTPAQTGRLDTRQHRHSVPGVLTIQRAPSETIEIPAGRHLTLRKALSEERPQPDGGESRRLVWLPMCERERMLSY